MATGSSPGSDHRQICEREWNAIRAEMKDLKGCQVTFISLAVTATGAILTFANFYRGKSGIAYLIPLVIIIPCWWIFFDKATTLTRHVGYCRVIEPIIAGVSFPVEFVGWEDALRKFREVEGGKKPSLTGNFNIIRFLWEFRLSQHTQRYWILVNYVFAALCFASLSFAARSLYLSGGMQSLTINSAVQVLSLGLILYSLNWNSRAVRNLVCGDNSYDRNEAIWKDILKIQSM